MMPQAPADMPWVDIIPPDAPAAAAQGSAIILALLLLFSGLALAVAVSRRPRRQARRKLRRLVHGSYCAAEDTRPAVFAIRGALREALGEQRLHTVRFEPSHAADWQHYLDRLAHACFAPDAPGADELRWLIGEALGWLNTPQVKP